MALPQLPFSLVRDYPELAVWQSGVETAVAALEAQVATLSQPTPESGLTEAERAKLAGIEPGAEVNQQADWDATSGDGVIQNKPALATVATSGSYNDLADQPTIPAAGIPPGGTAGQVLAKVDGTDYNVQWVTP